MTEPEQHEPHAYDTEEERDAANDKVYEIMEQYELRGDPMPGWIGSMILPPIECCPELEAEKKELYSELHQTGDHFK